MNVRELRDKNRQDLEKELESLLREQFNLRMQKTTKDVQGMDVSRFSKVRKEIAQVKTVLNENRIQEQNG